ncbi:MAG: heparinase II/III family protein [Planctomycetes bacterium]|nr:heparinase II/III family protein [Planctomycetota bacterium]
MERFASLCAGAVVLLASLGAMGAERQDLIGIVVANAGGMRGETIYVDFGGRPSRVKLSMADAKLLTVSMMGSTLPLPWEQVSDRRLFKIALKAAGEENADHLLVLLEFARRNEEFRDDAEELDALIRGKFPGRLPKSQPAAEEKNLDEKPLEMPEDPGSGSGTADGGVSGSTPGPFLKKPRGAFKGIYRGHPKIFVRDGNDAPAFGISLAELRRRASTPPWSSITASLGTVTEAGEVYSVPNLALAWLACGNESAAKRAIAIMKKPVNIDGTTTMGDHLEAVSLGYDWLYQCPAFSEDDKKVVRRNILQAADVMRKAMHDHVWHTRPYAWTNGVVFAGLALYPEEPRAEALAMEGIEHFKNSLVPARQVHDGTWQNSMAYGRKYMVRSVFHGLSAWSSATDEDLWFAASKQGNWAERMLYMLIYACRPDYTYVTYGDFYESGWTARRMSYASVLAATCGTRNPYGQGFLLELDKQYGTHRALSEEFGYYYLLFLDPGIAARPKTELPPCQLFGQRSLGFVFMRSGWGPRDLMFFFKCGDYYGNHGHHDQGTFELFYQRPLAVDSGFYGGDAGFSGPHRMKYMRRAIAHNTLVFPDASKPDEEGGQRDLNDQTVKDPRAFPSHLEMGDILRYEDKPAYTYVLSDVSKAYEKVSAFNRHIVYVKPNVIVILDAVALNTQYRRVWLFHTPTAPVIEKNGFRIANGGGSVAVECLLPASPAITAVEGYKVGGREYPVAGNLNRDISGSGYVMVEPSAVTGTATVFLNVFTVGGEAVARVPASVQDEGSGLKVTVGSRTLHFGMDGRSFQFK